MRGPFSLGTANLAYLPEVQMAKQSNRKGSFSSANGGGKFDGSSNWQGFINVYLDEKLKAAALGWYSEAENVDRAMNALLAAGYRCTFKFEENTGAYSCFITPTSATHENAGWGLSERASSWYKALCRVLYIHHVCLGGDWSSHKGPSFVEEDW